MAPSIRYMNQSAPFWDFVAGLENQGIEHHFFGHPPGNPGPSGPSGPSGPDGNVHHPPYPWGHWGGWNRGWQRDQELPHRGPPPAAGEGENENQQPTIEDETTEEKPREAGDPPEETPDQPCGPGRRGNCGGRRSGRGTGRQGPFPFGPHRHYHRHGRHGFNPMRGHPAFEFFSGMFGDGEGADSQDFKPEVDVFDTESAFVIHLSLPGAKKEDIGVNWDAEKSELGISGVVHRPGDEELLKTLALDERKVGAFDRKVRLGTRASPAQVDVDGISAKLESGILIVEVPKLRGDDYVEVKKVDVE